MEEAVALMVAGDALDPDYVSLWTSVASFDSVSFSEGAGAIVAQVSHDDWAERPGDMTAEQAKLALQQLVYTVQGIQQERVPVLVQNGADPATIYGIDTEGGLKAAKPLDVLALMNVTTPEEDKAVSGTFTASGVGSSFEATVLGRSVTRRAPRCSTGSPPPRAGSTSSTRGRPRSTSPASTRAPTRSWR